jgi:hypothetical protein
MKVFEVFNDIPNDENYRQERINAIDHRADMLFDKLGYYEEISLIRMFPCEHPEQAAVEPDILFKYTGGEWIRQQFGIIFGKYIQESRPEIVRDIEQTVKKLQKLALQRMWIRNQKVTHF